MRIVCLSDTHNQHRALTIPAGDVVVHAGDATLRGTAAEVVDFASWYGALPHKHKIFVAGNHDWLFQREPVLAQSILRDHGIEYLQDSSIYIEEKLFWGAPWQPWFHSWAFNLPRDSDEIAAKWALIPVETNVLVTHGPPLGFLDKLKHPRPGEVNVGCERLLARIGELQDLELHVFGHIHEAAGVDSLEGVLLVNAAICDLAYRPGNPINTVEL